MTPPQKYNTGDGLTRVDSSETTVQVAHEFNTLRGRVLGLIESWGLPEQQERGAKSIFKSLTYDSEKAIKELVEN